MTDIASSKNAPSLDWASLIASLDWSTVRRPQRLEDLQLMENTNRWMRSLPRGARPLQLHAKFPRIANELFRLWLTPVELDRYFASLLEDPRTDRKGFPVLVQEELAALRTYATGLRHATAQASDKVFETA